jgi:primosomal protein N' (replication factor Y) (superfamily II helicase)
MSMFQRVPAGFPFRRLLLQCDMLDEPRGPRTVECEPPLFADVIVPRHFAGPFTYLVPGPLRTVLDVGHLVFVPFGRSLVQGAVIALSAHGPPAIPLERLKAIRMLVTDARATHVSPRLLQLAKSVADAYVAPWGQCLRLVLPPKSTTVDRSRILLTKEGERALADHTATSPEAVQLLKRLRRRPLGIALSRLSATKDGSHSEGLASILDRGWAHRVHGRATDRGKESDRLAPAPELFVSNGRQTPGASHIDDWHRRVVRALESGQAARLLVQAASGDRLALLRAAAARTVELGRNVLVITGETGRAESLADALDDPAWGTVFLHSTMSDQMRAGVWNRIAEKQASVVVGTRAAVFLPLQPIGMIWVDRDEDPALKEPMEPRYHAREVAWLRAQDEQAVLVVASSHLSLEALGTGAPDDLMKAPEQADAWPQIEVVDLRLEDRRMVLSSRLHHAMRDVISRQGGVLLFLNRKAYAGALVCRDCGQVPRCPSCAVAFAFSRQKQVLYCHYCGGVLSIPDLCIGCGSARLQPVGEGTERVEEEVKRRFPSARVLRVDGDTLRSQKAAQAIWTRVRRREWDVLVGTQVLLSEDVVPTVDLAGVVQADAGLSLPDFRAAERTFHQLRDAASLVRPMAAGGRLIIQSYLPTHYVIQAAAKCDDAMFRSEELMHRTALGFPPAVRVIVLHVSGAEDSIVERASRDWAAGLARAEQTAVAAGHLTILGPVRSPVPRIRGRYRRQILIKSLPEFQSLPTVRSTVAELEAAYARRRVKFDVDVDPIDMW